MTVMNDAGFNGNGIVVDSMLGNVVDVAVLPGNAIVAADGQHLVKYTAKGSIDSTFGTGGVVGTPAMAVEVQSDGRIVAAGLQKNATSGVVDIVVNRFNANGTPDITFVTPSFGADVTGGAISFGTSKYTYEERVLQSPKETREQIDQGETLNRKLGLAIQSDGGIVVAASINGDVVVARYKANGTLDTGFDGSGMVRTASATFGAPVLVNDVSIWVDPMTSEIKPIVFGTIGSGANADMFVARYRANGALDKDTTSNNTRFTSQGFVTRNISGEDVAESGAVDGNGNILVIGSAAQHGHDFALIRLLGTGAIDTGFASSGTYTKDFGDHDFAHAVAVDKTLGTIVIVGERPGGEYNYDWAIVELDHNGKELDVTSSARDSGGGDPPVDDRAWAVAIDGNGLIVVGGHNDPAYEHRIPLFGAETLNLRNFEGDGQIGRFVSGADTDGDGLLDTWETRGIDGNSDGTVDFVLPNADPRHKDLYVETDFMNEDVNGNGILDPGEDTNGDGALTNQRPIPLVIPGVVAAGFGLATNTSLDQVVQAFLNAPVSNPDGTTGIRLHIQIDESIAFQPNLPNGSGDIPSIEDNRNPGKAGGFGTVAERTIEPDPNKANRVLDAKRLAYRYGLLGFRYTDSSGSSFGGEAPSAPANDFVVTTGYVDPTNQPAAFMHELGHDLGLGHGGAISTGVADNVNYKPNYKSIMNYSWSYPFGAGVGFTFDYSRESAPNLDESQLVESAGLGFSIQRGTEDANGNGVLDAGEDLIPNGILDTFTVPLGPKSTDGSTRFVPLRGAIDWDKKGGINLDSNTVSRDVNGDPLGTLGTLLGHTDWDKLVYGISFANGLHGGHDAPADDSGLVIAESLGVLVYTASTGNGPDDLTLRRHADMLEVYDNKNKSVVAAKPLQSTTGVELTGGQGEDDIFTIDFDSGGFFSLGLGIHIDGGNGGHDELRIAAGGHVQTGEYLPNSELPGSGVLDLDSLTVAFDGLEPVTISGVQNFTFVTPNSNDVVTVDTPATGQNRITGTSGGIAFESLTFYDIPNFTIDSAANDVASPADSITIGSLGLVASNLQNFAVQTGSGDDSLRIMSDRLSPTVGNAPIRWQAGSGSDSLFVEVDADLKVTNVSLTSSKGGTLLMDGVERVTLTGGGGNNVLDASKFTLGPATLNGGPGDDTLIASPGNDRLDGGDGFDTILIQGAAGNDAIDVFQLAPTANVVDSYQLTRNLNSIFSTLAITVTGGLAPNDISARPTVEEVRIEAGAGDDTIRVGHADEYTDENNSNGTPAQILRFSIDGGPPNASDRLVVRDDGTGDLVLVRQSAVSGSGSVTAAPAVNTVPGGDVVYQNIERVDVLPVDPVSGATGMPIAPGGPGGQIVIFKPDPFEADDTRLNATDLPLATQINATIDPGAIPDPFNQPEILGGVAPAIVQQPLLPGDEDWYKFTAPVTSSYRFYVNFQTLAMVPDGRAGLPSNGVLDIGVYGPDGNLIGNSGTVAGVGVQATFKAAEGHTYYLRVKGAPLLADSFAINAYNASLMNVGPGVGVYSGTSVAVDMNGNGFSGPANVDPTNRGMTFQFGGLSDQRFAGKFAPTTLFGFDVLAAYGRANAGSPWQFSIDVNGDGRVEPNEIFNSPAQVSALAVAGNFDGNSTNGDEIALFTGNTWYILPNLMTNPNGGMRVVPAFAPGFPVAGDFDGDGTVDLATYYQGNFNISFGPDFNRVNQIIPFAAPGVLNRPVAADMDGDGITDLGLWIPYSGVGGPTGEFRFLISGLPLGTPSPGAAALNHQFNPATLGADVAYHFGNPTALPLVGNFDPPPVATSSAGNGATSQGANVTGPVNSGSASSSSQLSISLSTQPSATPLYSQSQARSLIASLYHDILGRAPDPGGWGSYTTQLQSGVSRDTIANQMLSSAERDGNEVEGFYATYLHRHSDPGGRATWTDSLLHGMTEADLARAFVLSAEHTSRHPTQESFVDALYLDILGRPSDPGGRAAYLQALTSGRTLSDIAASIASSPENINHIVDQLYHQVLHRAADPVGLQFYSAKLHSGEYSERSLTLALLASDEYFAKIGSGN